jgi:hypothetical protein
MPFGCTRKRQEAKTQEWSSCLLGGVHVSKSSGTVYQKGGGDSPVANITVRHIYALHELTNQLVSMLRTPIAFGIPARVH